MLVKITNGNVDTYPYSAGQLRRDNPNTSFPKRIPDEMLESYGLYTVVYTDMPSVDDRTQKVEQEATPSLVSGAWTIGWSTSDKTAEEVQEYDDNQAATVRSERDGLLAQSDWTQFNDSPLTGDLKTSWATYRQTLRDITSTDDWPNVSFPATP